MNQQNRIKVINAGFTIYRRCPLSKTITSATRPGGWARVGSFPTKVALNKAWALLMKLPTAIDD